MMKTPILLTTRFALTVIMMVVMIALQEDLIPIMMVQMMMVMEPVIPTSYRGKQYTSLEHLTIVMVTTPPATGRMEYDMSFLVVPGQRIFLLKMAQCIHLEQGRGLMLVIGSIRLGMIFLETGERQRP